jgi:hypothetical protein
MHNPTAGKSVTLRPILALGALLATAQVHGQQNINVTAANSITNTIYSVTFAPPGGSTTVLNTDEKSLYSLQSLVFVPNNNLNVNPPTFTFDLLAADNQNGKILRYSGDFSGSPPTTKGTVISQAASIIYPTGLSVDLGGDLYVVNDAPGHSPLPQVWVLPANPSGGFNNAVPIDKTSFGKLQATLETLIVGTPLGSAANPGDLLVLTSNPAAVLKYSGSNGNGPQGAAAPTTLIGQCPAAPICIPAGTVPGGMAVWPADNSLLITTESGGKILRYSFSGTPTQLPDFADGLPSGLYKIKTGYQSGFARAFVAQSGPGNHGSILELGPTLSDPSIQLLDNVTSGVQAPEGIAVTNAVQAPANTCQQSKGGCDLLGGNLLLHTVVPGLAGSGILVGNIVENVCVVPTDLRITQFGTCTGHTQSVNAVCPGWDNTNNLVIPDTLCGSSGITRQGYALIKTLTAHDQFNGTYVANSASTDEVLPNPNGDGMVGGNPGCGPGPVMNSLPIGTLAWAPLSGEGTVLESPDMLDVTGGCGSIHGGTDGVSLWGVGLALNTSATELQSPLSMPLWNFGQTKYSDLTQTINNMTSNGNINSATVSQELYNNGHSPLGCLDVSLADYANATNPSIDTFNSPQWIADMQNAANLLTNADATNNTTCDSIVYNNLASFQESSTPLVLNPSGQLRSRLANLYYTINTLILENPAAGTWPLPLSVSASPTTGATATLSWNISSVASNCSLTSSDGFYTGTSVSGTGALSVTPQVSGSPVAYTITCTVPSGTMVGGQNPTSTSVTAYVTSPLQPIVVNVNPSGVGGGGSVQVTWTPAAGAMGCMLSSNGQGTFSAGTTTVSGPTTGAAYTATYKSVEEDSESNGGIVTFTATCTTGASPGSAQITVGE